MRDHLNLKVSANRSLRYKCYPVLQNRGKLNLKATGNQRSLGQKVSGNRRSLRSKVCANQRSDRSKGLCK